MTLFEEEEKRKSIGYENLLSIVNVYRNNSMHVHWSISINL